MRRCPTCPRPHCHHPPPRRCVRHRQPACTDPSLPPKVPGAPRALSRRGPPYGFGRACADRRPSSQGRAAPSPGPGAPPRPATPAASEPRNYLHSFAFPRTSCSWNRPVRRLFRSPSFTDHCNAYFSLRNMYLRVLYVSPWRDHSFIFGAEQYPVVWMQHSLSCGLAYRGRRRVVATVNKPSVSICERALV